MPKLKNLGLPDSKNQTSASDPQKKYTRKKAAPKKIVAEDRMSEQERAERISKLEADEAMAIDELQKFFYHMRRYVAKGFKSTFHTANRHRRVVKGVVEETYKNYKPSVVPQSYIAAEDRKINITKEKNNLLDFIKND